SGSAVIAIAGRANNQRIDLSSNCCRGPPIDSDPPKAALSAHPSRTRPRPQIKTPPTRAYQVALPLHEGSYKWSGGNVVTVFDSTVVAVETDAGILGHREACPLRAPYRP